MYNITTDDFSVPKKGAVTKQNAKDLYYAVKSWNMADSKNFCRVFIGAMINSDGAIIDKIKTLMDQKSDIATYKQVNALNRIIFGRHYSVEFYVNLMTYLKKNFEIKKVDSRLIEHPEHVTAELPTAENDTPFVDFGESDHPIEEKKIDDHPDALQHDAIDFLKTLATSIKDNGKEFDKQILLQDIESITKILN